MKIKIKLIILFFFVMGIGNLYSQVYNQPNIALKSHETLEISKVEINGQSTSIYLSIENRITGGNFCADRNIFLIYPDGSRLKLMKAINIPVCPDSFSFKSIGEKLQFTLEFPPLKPGTKWIDLIEECKEYCFSFYGVCLDSELNKKIDDASVLAENKEPAKAMISFIKIADAIENKNSGIEGLIYINIITLAKETGNITKATEWYTRLKMSGISRCEDYIKHLNSQGIIY
ncbi:MAG TPA: hypothetical protein VF346_05595 [Bacteroidales bacterium]